jgi:hypothetical protein
VHAAVDVSSARINPTTPVAVRHGGTARPVRQGKSEKE